MDGGRVSYSGGKIVIGGASGLVGSLIIDWFGEQEAEIVALSRSSKPVKGATRTVQWDGKSFSGWEKEIDGAEMAINLSGSPIAVRWTKENLAKIRSSRVDSTMVFGEAIEVASERPKVWINSSAVGFYGDTGSRERSEASPVGEGLLPEMCQEWEDAADKFSHLTRQVKLRTGIVLSMSGGMLPMLNRLTKMFIGGAVPPGSQYISWIHERDMVRAIACCATNPQVSGAVNAVAPNPVTNAELMAELRKLHSRPWIPPAPTPFIRAFSALSGIPMELIQESQRVVPEILLGQGFKFEFPTIREALQNLCDDSPHRWAERLPDGA